MSTGSLDGNGEAAGRTRVLVVDDDSEMRALLADVLGDEGYAVEGVPNGAEALIRLRTESFAAIVLDKNMPGLSGLDLLPGLRTICPDIPSHHDHCFRRRGHLHGRDRKGCLRVRVQAVPDGGTAAGAAKSTPVPQPTRALFGTVESEAMNQIGEFRLCSGCGEWAIWMPQDRRGPVYCCEACAWGLGCCCTTGADEGLRLSSIRRDLPQGGQYALSESVATQGPRPRGA